MKELENLGLSNNKLRTLPEGFGNLKNLKKLNLKNNSLSELPEFLPKKLEDVIVSNNFLTKIPPSLCSLAKSKLNASNNLNGYLNGCTPQSYHLKKTYMPPYTEQSMQTIDNLINDACQSPLKDWMERSPEGEKRKEACNKIVSFLLSPNQTHLYLNKLNLSSLPEIFKDFRFNRLQILNLSNNKLESVPKEIANLKQLKTLDLSNNKLISIPEEIMNSEQINIDLINNKFINLPPNFLKKLIDQFSKEVVLLKTS